MAISLKPYRRGSPGHAERIDAAHRMFADKVAMYTGLSVDAVTGTEAAVFEGQVCIEAGLADELINASDAISGDGNGAEHT